MTPFSPPDIDTRSYDYHLTVCIVTWNSARDIGPCLDSLAACRCASPVEVIVVDNGSRDDTVARVERQYPEVHIEALGHNRGFATANNRAITAARGREVMLLNPDTLVHPGAFDTLLRFLDTHPKAGMVGPKLLNADGSLQMSCRHFPNFGAGLFRNTPLGRILPKNRFATDYLMTDWDHLSPRRVDWLSGACCLVRREALERVGLLDDKYFMYCEDVDWGYRMRAAGWERWYVPTAQITHLIGGSSDQRMLGSVIHFHQSMYRFYRKHYRSGALWLVQPVAVTGIALRAVSATSTIFFRRLRAKWLARRRLRDHA